jgi:hypothetical protein
MGLKRNEKCSGKKDLVNRAQAAEPYYLSAYINVITIINNDILKLN